jgi:hypothetical protein
LSLWSTLASATFQFIDSLLSRSFICSYSSFVPHQRFVMVFCALNGKHRESAKNYAGLCEAFPPWQGLEVLARAGRPAMQMVRLAYFAFTKTKPTSPGLWMKELNHYLQWGGFLGNSNRCHSSRIF